MVPAASLITTPTVPAVMLVQTGTPLGSLMHGEIVATVLLYTPAYRPLSIAINDELYYANYGTAASFGVIQVLLVLLVIIIMRRVQDREKWLKVF